MISIYKFWRFVFGYPEPEPISEPKFSDIRNRNRYPNRNFRIYGTGIRTEDLGYPEPEPVSEPKISDIRNRYPNRRFRISGTGIRTEDFRISEVFSVPDTRNRQPYSARDDISTMFFEISRDFFEIIDLDLVSINF